MSSAKQKVMLPGDIPPTKPTPIALVEEYITLRDQKKVAEDKFKEWLKANLTDRMDLIEIALLDHLNALGAESIAGKSGTAYKKLTTSVTIADAREFRRHVIGGEHWDLADWRANKTVVEDMIEKGEAVPPGVNRTAFYTIGIRRKS
jgi:hypothetical protein